MKVYFLPFLLAVGALAGCKLKPSSESDAGPTRGPKGEEAVEHIDASEKAEAAKLKPVKDPAWEEIMASRLHTRQDYNNRRFDKLEKQGAELRARKETFGTGSWKIVQFYESFGCSKKEPESMWQLHDRIHQEWMAAKPASISARVAYADFLTDYAWQARGSGYADKVTEDGWRLFGERLAAARQVLVEARALEEKDPCWWMMALTVALGQGWERVEYDALVEEAHAFEPKFWGYDTTRAYSLLPRWHGEPGDWEAFAEQTAARREGLGVELYARIVLHQHGYYDNVFRETKASWPKTKDGLSVLIRKYPDSLAILSDAAVLATRAEDRAMAKEWFDKIGDRYLPAAWENPEQFVHYRRWAETGKW